MAGSPGQSFLVIITHYKRRGTKKWNESPFFWWYRDQLQCANPNEAQQLEFAQMARTLLPSRWHRLRCRIGLPNGIEHVVRYNVWHPTVLSVSAFCVGDDNEHYVLKKGFFGKEKLQIIPDT